MDEDAFMVVLHLLHDTISFNPDTLNIWLENLDNFGMDLTLALNHLIEGNTAAAHGFLQKAGQREDLTAAEMEDLQLMPLLFSILQGKSPYNLEEGDLTQLETLTDNEGSFTGNIAENILSSYGYHFPITYYLTVGNNAHRSAPIVIQNAEILKEVWVQPNPNDDIFSFVWKPFKKNRETGILQISDLSGRTVTTLEVIAFEQLLIDLKQHPSGVYFYQLNVEGDVPQVGKIIIHKS